MAAEDRGSLYLIKPVKALEKKAAAALPRRLALNKYAVWTRSR